MSFTSYNFLFIFLPFAIISHFITAKKYRNRLLLLLNLFFLAYSGFKGLPFIFFSTLTYYCGAILIDKFGSKHLKSLVLLSVIAVNIAILIIFKYPAFFVDLFNNLFTAGLDVKKLVIPLGISFYTFQGIAYIADVYTGKIEAEYRIIEFTVFMTFFAQFTSGPILRFQPFVESLDERNVKLDNIYEGVSRFIIGLWKKLFIANRFAWIATTILKINPANLSMGSAWMGAIAFSIQIYFDFAGYSDMAIGLANTFGFKFPENFNYPYIATSITDFWRRWHISLSLWFRDYIYIPLGGNRGSTFKYIRNLICVWLLTGIWHGATFNFVIWGLFNFVIIFMEKFIYGKYLEKAPKVLRHLYTLIMIAISWTIFQTNGMAVALNHLRTMFYIGSPLVGVNDFLKYVYAFRFEWCIALVLCTPVLKNLVDKYQSNPWFSVLKDIVVLGLLLIAVIMLVSGTFSSFLYQAF